MQVKIRGVGQGNSKQKETEAWPVLISVSKLDVAAVACERVALSRVEV